MYGSRDILFIKVVKQLLDTGISLQQIRAAVRYLRDLGTEDLARVTLMSDGKSIYKCVSSDEVVGVLQRGQGVLLQLAEQPRWPVPLSPLSPLATWRAAKRRPRRVRPDVLD